MLKKLDKLILKAFAGPFAATFFIAFFVLMMQNIWKYIDDLVGKGLDWITILTFIWYAGSGLLTLALPIAILISSIMTFGNLGETFELVAVRSSGISLIRFMRPLIWIAIFLCGVTYIFGNYVVPYSNLKFVTLYNDIFYKKPAFDLKEGVFFTYIPNYAIKVGKKEADGKTIRNVVIYEQGNQPQDVCIAAEKGVMSVSPDKRFLQFELENGYRYQERGVAGDTNTEFIRIQFKSFTKLFDMSSLQKTNTPDSIFKNSHRMLSARQLGKRIDSLQKFEDSLENKSHNSMSTYLHYTKLPEAIWKKTPAAKNEKIIPDSLKQAINSRVVTVANEIKNSLSFNSYEISSKKEDIRLSKIEWHRKYALSLACLIFFFIGAPLGSIIRKGGFGMPLLMAILLFLVFHLLNVFGEKFSREEVTTPALGMWISILALLPLGILLTYKAMNDSQLFNKEFYTRLFKLKKSGNIN